MATTAKTVNYTEAQTAELKAAYEPVKGDEKAAAAVIATFAEKFGKTTKSIIAKLSREGVYQPKVYKSKTGETPVKKDDQADAIGKVLRLTEPETESLTKATKGALQKILHALANSVPVEAETPEVAAAKKVSLEVMRESDIFDEDDMVSLARVNASTLAKLAEAFKD